MARYIDADKLVEKYERAMKDVWNKKTRPLSWNEAYDCVIADIVDEPTAEVVPKSEVEALQEALSKAEADVKNYMKVAEYQQRLSVKRYHEIKRLNEEIETLKDNNEHLAVLLEEAKTEANRYKRYYFHHDYDKMIAEAKQEVAREIFAEIEKALKEYHKAYGLFGEFRTRAIMESFAELKKKYTEGD